MDNIIVVKDYKKKYGNYVAVDNISFEVERGKIFAFLGPNGAGKSTTINTLCTIIDKTSGTLLIDGIDINVDKNYVRSLIGVVFQEPTLDNKMTVEENLKMHCCFYKLPKDIINERINFVLSLVDLNESKNTITSSLSGGMKRRVEIARSLLHSPKILFLDEPTTGLDPQTRAKIWEYIIKLQKEKNLTIFLTTHYIEEAEICDKVAIINNGKIIAFDTPQALKQLYTKDLAHITSSNERELEELLLEYNIEYNIEYTKKYNCYCIYVNDLKKLMDIISKHKLYIKNLEIKKGTLNDVFLEITGKDIRE